MNCYLLECEESTFYLYLPDENVLAASIRNGLDPKYVRGVLAGAEGGRGTCFELLGRASKTDRKLPDLMYWSWVPAFSSAAYDLLLEIGAARSDFLTCRLVGRQDVVHLHLPDSVENIIDVDKSIFSHFVPVDPPLPFSAVLVRPNAGWELLLPIFRTRPPGSSQVTPDVYFRGDAVDGWTERRLIGASFKQVS
ncbi:hypothetical protein [Rhizobacter sp. P5_C2]